MCTGKSRGSRLLLYRFCIAIFTSQSSRLPSPQKKESPSASIPVTCDNIRWKERSRRLTVPFEPIITQQEETLPKEKKTYGDRGNLILKGIFSEGKNI